MYRVDTPNVVYTNQVIAIALDRIFSWVIFAEDNNGQQYWCPMSELDLDTLWKVREQLLSNHIFPIEAVTYVHELIKQSKEPKPTAFKISKKEIIVPPPKNPNDGVIMRHEDKRHLAFMMLESATIDPAGDFLMKLGYCNVTKILDQSNKKPYILSEGENGTGPKEPIPFATLDEVIDYILKHWW